jgi:hypothetical protein
VTNRRLRGAITAAGLQPDELAELLQVDVKTVRRWLLGTTPYGRHRTQIAKTVQVAERELWPEATPGSTERHTPERLDAYPDASDPNAPSRQRSSRVRAGGSTSSQAPQTSP